MSLIYVVEDDKNIREIEVIALKNSGFEVEEFETAGDFNKALDQKEPDLLLLDIMLPDADGLTIVKNIRQSKRGRQLPIILVTAKTTEIDKVRGLYIVLYLLLLFVFPDAKLTFQALFWLFSVQDQ